MLTLELLLRQRAVALGARPQVQQQRHQQDADGELPRPGLHGVRHAQSYARSAAAGDSRVLLPRTWASPRGSFKTSCIVGTAVLCLCARNPLQMLSTFSTLSLSAVADNPFLNPNGFYVQPEFQTQVQSSITPGARAWQRAKLCGCPQL